MLLAMATRFANDQLLGGPTEWRLLLDLPRFHRFVHKAKRACAKSVLIIAPMTVAKSVLRTSRNTIRFVRWGVDKADS